MLGVIDDAVVGAGCKPRLESRIKVLTPFRVHDWFVTYLYPGLVCQVRAVLVPGKHLRHAVQMART